MTPHEALGYCALGSLTITVLATVAALVQEAREGRYVQMTLLDIIATFAILLIPFVNVAALLVFGLKLCAAVVVWKPTRSKKAWDSTSFARSRKTSRR